MQEPDNTKDGFLHWKARFIKRLAIFHFVLILIFDFLAVYFPEIMTRPLSASTPFTIGVFFSLVIVISVISATVFYTWRVNEAESRLETTQGEEE